MKLSKLLHIVSVAAGLVGVVTFAAAILGGADNRVLGVSKTDALLCAGILMLIAIWIQIATVHHMMLEKRGEII
ncbi:MAG: hypothetical protein AAB343_03345, partial [Patescibacteria group bacterium]